MEYPIRTHGGIECSSRKRISASAVSGMVAAALNLAAPCPGRSMHIQWYSDESMDSRGRQSFPDPMNPCRNTMLGRLGVGAPLLKKGIGFIVSDFLLVNNDTSFDGASSPCVYFMTWIIQHSMGETVILFVWMRADQPWQPH
jgi:hypothetical protein